MGYPENTAVSGVGQKILNDIFDLIYLQSDAPTNQIARMINNRSQIKEVVTNFSCNFERRQRQNKSSQLTRANYFIVCRILYSHIIYLIKIG